VTWRPPEGGWVPGIGAAIGAWASAWRSWPGRDSCATGDQLQEPGWGGEERASLRILGQGGRRCLAEAVTSRSEHHQARISGWPRRERWLLPNANGTSDHLSCVKPVRDRGLGTGVGMVFPDHGLAGVIKVAGRPVPVGHQQVMALPRWHLHGDSEHQPGLVRRRRLSGLAQEMPRLKGVARFQPFGGRDLPPDPHRVISVAGLSQLAGLREGSHGWPG